MTVTSRSSDLVGVTVTSRSSDRVAAVGLHERYRPPPGTYDEMIAADGSIRPHWARFLDGLEGMSEGELARRWRLAERLLHENGLTYTADATTHADRPWDLDFVPVLIGADEWRMLEQGLIQRARLLNAILADLYGPQTLLRDGHLPAAVVLGNPQFLRPCHGFRPRDGLYLHVYAADLGRGPDGLWWVLADRTQAPSGVGFALENRIILSRCLPEMFRDLHVRRLANYFQAMHDSLVAGTDRDNPRVVLLTPGPGAEGYFAHAYLARYLGYTLVEGGDLTVRDDRVFLKSVDGLKPVDLILRRIEGEECDPLELRADSPLGVAGLTRAARAGNVVVVDALGSGLAETKAMLPFLQPLCRRLFCEDLRLPNTPTWWCGDERVRDYVLDNLDRLSIDSAFKRRSLLSKTTSAVPGAALSGPERLAVIDRITTRGHEYVGQELVPLSTTPAWTRDGLQPRPMTLRVFLAATRDGGYAVMPGGLTRVSASRDARAVGLHRGDGTKDTWVLSDEPLTGSFTLLRPPLSYVKPNRSGKDLPSRAADNLFWLGRYAERSEDIMRVLRSVVRRLTDDASPVDNVAAMQRILRVLFGKSELPPAVEGRGTSATAILERQLASVMFDPDLPCGLRQTLGHLHRTAALVRDRLSVDAWRTLGRLHTEANASTHHAGPPAHPLEAGQALESLDDALRTLAAFSGMEMENMTRNHGWRFLDMGRRLERARHLVELLRSLLTRGNPAEDGSLILLLELADSTMTYRSRYLTTPMLPPVIDLLLLDETNPRSIAFQLAAIVEVVERLPRDADEDARTAEQRLVLSLLTEVRLAEIAPLCDEDGRGRRGALETLLNAVGAGLPRLSELITRNYFSHAEARRPADLR
ncbi:MAG: circularly permuted type 2 ATP-grasp protein [Bacteroidota bacterium]